MLTHAAEDYLKSIYKLQEKVGKVSTGILAEYLNVKPASATGMIKKLKTMKLVRHERYQGVTLTDAGKSIALEIIRHHRLLELYLFQGTRCSVGWRSRGSRKIGACHFGRRGGTDGRISRIPNRRPARGTDTR